MAKSKAKSKKSSTKPANKKAKPKAKVSRKAVAKKPARSTARAAVTKKKPVRPVKKTVKKPAMPTAGSAPPSMQEVILRRIVDRLRPLFRSPMDGRIKQLVDAVGLDLAVMMMHLARKREDATHRDELIETLNALAGRPAPLPHGSWIWHELMTTDVDGSKRFYQELLGWQPQVMEMMPGFNYTTFANNGVDLAGMMAISPEHGEMSSGWGVYVKVDDVDAAAEKAEMLGGEIVVPAHDIPVGRWAMVKDPAGAVICVYKSKA